MKSRGAKALTAEGAEFAENLFFLYWTRGPECAIEKDFGGLCFELLFPFVAER
jgi:hypothetical protein